MVQQMINKIFTAILFAGVIGCNGAVATPPAVAKPLPTLPSVVQNTPAPPPVLAGRADLPAGWKEVKKDSWSVGVPSTMQEIKPTNDDSNIVLKFKSEREILLLGVEKNSEEDLKAYAYKFAMDMQEDGSEVLSAKAGIVNGNQSVMISFKINESIMAMHFLTLVDDTVYNVGCGINMTSTKEEVTKSGEICVNFTKSLKVTSVTHAIPSGIDL